MRKLFAAIAVSLWATGCSKEAAAPQLPLPPLGISGVWLSSLQTFQGNVTVGLAVGVTFRDSSAGPVTGYGAVSVDGCQGAAVCITDWQGYPEGSGMHFGDSISFDMRGRIAHRDACVAPTDTILVSFRGRVAGDSVVAGQMTITNCFAIVASPNFVLRRQ